MLEDQDFKWYAVHTQVGQEEKVKNMILSKAKEVGLESDIAEILVPQEEVIEVRKGKKELVKKCMYPSYVFIKSKMNVALYNTLKRLPLVTGFVGSKNEPIPIDESEVKKVVDKINKAKEAPRLSISFEHGEKVRVIEGPFSNFVGTIEEVDITKGRLKILISIFGRPTPVELDYNEVEKA
ncbi:MAG: transcription termination/antitermination protein NusG [Desulfurella sp.]|jgi:transcriptional antiterminator NusG|uniref:transcription termination/antitermination protein NusG n=1 Tax=Desulfurella sp. TaxID=1962857 RepID=UPI0003E0880B|nr:transcription antitermination protein NusG [Desulfurella acetivorans A63]